tara:strand:- start:169 stop:1671 length:1503 start_codon:yes stop_codon:yes gene_type:complete
MGLAKGGLVESVSAVEKIAPKGTETALSALMGSLPYPNDVWADKNPPTSPNRPWRILTASDNFKVLMQRHRGGKKVAPPKSMKPRTAARRREAVVFQFGEKNYKFLFVDVGPARHPTKPQTAQQERGSAWIFRRVLRDNVRYDSWEDIMNDDRYYELLDVFPNVNPEWLQSYYKQNVRMLHEFDNYRWNEFSRDGGFMHFISNFVKTRFGIARKDTWNTADIWMIRGKEEDFIDEIEEQLPDNPSQTIRELNMIMRSWFKSRKLVGVSLKLISGNQAHWKEYNVDDLTLDERNNYNFGPARIKMDFRTVVKDGANTFGTQDTTVNLGEGDHRFKFQIKDLAGKPPFGNLKFEGSDPNHPAARAGKAPEPFTEQIFKDLGLMFRNDNQRYAPDAATWNIQKPQWQRVFRYVSSSPGVTMKGTESDFVDIMDAMYQLEDARGPARGPWIAQSKLMQLDFIYETFHQMDTNERREFWTDMAFLSLRLSGDVERGFFGPFGKLY